jgi:ABC-type sugar transport system substrate-binding protein
MRRLNRRGWVLALALTAAALLAAPAGAHPGSGIVVDRHGQVFFVALRAGVRDYASPNVSPTKEEHR